MQILWKMVYICCCVLKIIIMKFKLIFAFILIITLTFACSTLHRGQIKKGLEEYDLGVEAGKNGEYEKSVNHFLKVEKIILKYPKLEDSIISKKYLLYAMSLSLLDLLEFDEF
jgi:hypothetical protein